jgi:hypothetical protein
MNIFKFINVKLFLLSLFIGLFAVYLFMPDMRIIRVYPTPENVSILQYKDQTDTCFSIKQSEVTCPTNENEITKIPVQS